MGAGPHQSGRGRRRVLAGLGAVAFWIAAWQLASVAVGSPFVLAGPADTLAALARLLPTAAFWRQVGFSAARIVGGCAAGYAAGIALAAAASALPGVRALLRPALSAMKGVPVACVTVILLIWFGSRNVSAAAVFLVVLPAVYFPVLTGLDGIDRNLRELFCVHRVGRVRRLLALTVPGTLPFLTAASRTALGMSWKAGVAAELIGVPLGSVGERIYQAKLLLETADLFAWTVVVALAAWIFEHTALAGMAALWPATGRLAARLGRGGGRRGDPTAPGPAACAAAPLAAGAAAPGRLPVDGALLRARGLAPGHDGRAACAPVTFDLAADGTLCLRGPSGAGKTTLLRTLAGLEEPADGVLAWAAGARPRLSAVFQEARLVEDLTAVENVLLLAAAGTDAAAARDLLAEVLPVEAAERPVRELSGGQRRRVELVRALAAPGELILLDEPFAGLDSRARLAALACIARHRGGRALIFATHDGSDAEALSARTIRLEAAR